MSDLICPELHPDRYVNRRCELDLDHPGMHRAGVLRWGNYTGSYSAPVPATPDCPHGQMKYLAGSNAKAPWEMFVCPLPFGEEGQCRKTLSVPEGWVRPDGTVKEFFVEDEPVEKVRAAFDASTEGGVTAPPVDMVSDPPHYKKHPSGVECIQITEHMNFCLGNAVKYIWRAGEKGDAVEDLEKARWYVDREIEKRKREAA